MQDPCHGKIKKFAVILHGCEEHREHSRWKRHCSLQGQWLLCDEDIEFLASLELPERKETELLPHVAVMVDTSYRPRIQHYVVHNVRNNTGWPIQLFHGPSNGPKLRLLFEDLIREGVLTLTDLKVAAHISSCMTLIRVTGSLQKCRSASDSLFQG